MCLPAPLHSLYLPHPSFMLPESQEPSNPFCPSTPFLSLNHSLPPLPHLRSFLFSPSLLHPLYLPPPSYMILKSHERSYFSPWNFTFSSSATPCLLSPILSPLCFLLCSFIPFTSLLHSLSCQYSRNSNLFSILQRPTNSLPARCLSSAPSKVFSTSFASSSILPASFILPPASIPGTH